MPDVEVIDTGSVIGFWPKTESAEEWFAENVYSEPWQWMGPVLYVDHRCAADLGVEIEGAGFTVEGRY